MEQQEKYNFQVQDSMTKRGHLLIELLIYLTLASWIVIILYGAYGQYAVQQKTLTSRSEISAHFYSGLQLLTRDIHQMESLHRCTPTQLTMTINTKETVMWKIEQDRLLRSFKKGHSLACAGMQNMQFQKKRAGILFTFKINKTSMEQFIGFKNGALL
ncbi:MAG TPA: hypothetical protein QGF02_03160 [Candidatus Babeliales bacterium]|nr:hypothetical protein [Candidatus Babeliales bacterium]